MEQQLVVLHVMRRGLREKSDLQIGKTRQDSILSRTMRQLAVMEVQSQDLFEVSIPNDFRLPNTDFHAR